jgi:hypothetical protein
VGRPIEAAIDPFLKIPTANHQLGNGKVEAGVVIPTDAARKERTDAVLRSELTSSRMMTGMVTTRQ